MTLQGGNPSGSPSSERGGNGSAGMSASGTSAGGASSPLPGTAAGPTTTPASSSSPYGASDTGRMQESSHAAGRGWSRPDEANRSEFGAFLDDLSELARGGGQSADLRGELERRVSQARHRMGAALDQGMEMTVRARDQMHRGVEYSREAVSERPLSYLTMAMVGGLLIGMLLSRRD
jgi:ElaB/YqjD/DUF883 family membrane-anchored ribosome-binding protein